MRRFRSAAVAVAMSVLLAGATVPGAVAAAEPDGLVADYSFAGLPEGATVPNRVEGSAVGDAATMVGPDTRRPDILPAGLWTGHSLRLTGGAKTSEEASWVRLPDYGQTPDGSITLSVQARAMSQTLGGFNFLWNIGNDQTQAYLFATMRNAANLTRTGITLTSNGGEQNARHATGGLQADRWYNLTTVLDAPADELRLYLDGALVGEVSGVGSTVNDLPQTLNTIARSPWPDPYFAGEVSSLRVYDRALGATEVAQVSGDAFAELSSDVRAGLEEGLTFGFDTVTLPGYGGLVTWVPGDYSGDGGAQVSIAGGTATVTRPESTDAQILLPADLLTDGDTVQVQVPVRIPARTSPTAQLVIPAKVTGDLPASVAGREVTYHATDADGATSTLLAADGTVTRPAAGAGPTALQVTATIDGVDEPVRAALEVLDHGGEVASYVKEVTFDGDVRSDLLAYPDDRRADALHLAARVDGEQGWTLLNRSQPVLHVLWDGSQSANPNSQMGSPSLFYDRDGRLAAVSSQNNAEAGIYVWDTAQDGTTFTAQRLVNLATDAVVTDPVVVWDAAASQYKVRWTDGEGRGHLSVFDHLGVGAHPLAHYEVEPLPRGVAGLPTEAAEASALVVGSADLTALTAAYGDLQNTGVTPVELTVPAGTEVSAADLGTVTMEYNDGSTKHLAVDWSAEDLAAIDPGTPGTYEVNGTVRSSSFAYPFVEARADPHIFFNEDDGHYYATGSHYAEPADGAIDAATSYRAIGLRRAGTVEELQSAPEELVVDPDNTPGYGWGAFIWAPEVHRINDTWYILVGMSRGEKVPGQWGWTNNMVLIPFTGTTEEIRTGGMLDKENWGAPIALTESPASFDVSYYEDDDGQGYFIIPRNAGIEIVKATMGPKGTVPRFDGTPERVYSIRQAWHYGKHEGSYTETHEGTDQGIIEGPYLVAHGEHLYLSYSGGTVDKYYNLGLLWADRGADIMDPASWREVPYPLLTSEDTVDGQVGDGPHVGGGHNSFAVDEAGNLVLVYHARPHPDPHAGEPGAGGLFDPDRNTVVKSVNVRADGRLDLAVTADQEVAPQNRTVTATVTVGPPSTSVAVETSTRCVAGRAVLVVRTTNEDVAPVDVEVSSPFGTKSRTGLQPGAGATHAFTTRVVDLPAAEVDVAVADGDVVTTPYDAATCRAG